MRQRLVMWGRKCSPSVLVCCTAKVTTKKYWNPVSHFEGLRSDADSKEYFTNCIRIQATAVFVQLTITIWGSDWEPKFCHPRIMTLTANCRLFQELRNICKTFQVHSHVSSTPVLLLQKVNSLNKALLYQAENSFDEQVLNFPLLGLAHTRGCPEFQITCLPKNW